MQQREAIAAANPLAKIAPEYRGRGSDNVANFQLVCCASKDRGGNQSELAWQRRAAHSKKISRKTAM
jgi:hypothetical protein